MATVVNAPAGWYPDPGDPGTRRYWDGEKWLAPAGWYPDPDDPRAKRRWSGNAWEPQRRPRASARYVGAAALVMVTGIAAFGATSMIRVGPAFDPAAHNRPWCEWVRNHAADAVSPQMWMWWALIVALLAFAVALYFTGGRGRRGLGWIFLVTTILLGAVAAALAYPPVLIAMDRIGNCTP